MEARTTTHEDVLAAYDTDVVRHIELVRHFLGGAQRALHRRGVVHDASKFDPAERDVFAPETRRRDSVPFGTPAYVAHLERVRPALDHHYRHNDHHPEHHVDGVDGMDLVMLLEMVCDWMAASMRAADGDVRAAHAAVDANQGRFGYSDEFADMLHRTVDAISKEVNT